MIDKLLYYYPAAQVSWISEGDWNTLEWFGPGEKPDEDEFAALPWPPIPTLAEAKAAKLAELGNVRWQRQEAGVTVGSVQIKTDPESRATITAAYFLAKDDPEMVRRWKVAPGMFIDIDGDLMIAIGNAVLEYIQTCFDRESDLTDAVLAAADLEGLEAIDITAGWP